MIVLGPLKRWLSLVNRSNQLPGNFALALPAKRALERLRSEIDARYPEDPVAVVSIAWGYSPGVNPLSGDVVIGFYPRSLMADVAHGVQEVFGMKLVFARARNSIRCSPARFSITKRAGGFFLRDP